MKSYTDLEQSKKLANILPTESADFIWLIERLHTDGPGYEVRRAKNEVNEPENYWPCWSLAALLSVLPIVYINNKKEVCGPLHIDITDSETPFVLWYVNPLHKGCIIELQTKEYDNLVDACVEMILKLKENNKLL